MKMERKLKILLLPYAGGSGLYYSHWAKFFEENITLVPLELPGRGLKFKESLCTDLNDVINGILDKVKEEIVDSEYILFGYCVGTIVAYELYKRIVEYSLRQPKHCILCAHPSPDVSKKGKKLKDTTDNELMEEWIRGSRISREEFESKRYLQSLFDVWKADCIMMDKYSFAEPVCKFNCDISLINGSDDSLYTLSEINQWSLFTNGHCDNYEVKGSHDFLKSNEAELIDTIIKIIKKIE